jgi:hypothetical protein
MRMNGESIRPIPDIPVVIPRDNGPDYVFIARAVLDYTEFEALCPEPKVPFIGKPGKGMVPHPEAPSYREAVEAHRLKRTNWMFVKSLEATEGLEWETIDMEDPETWGNLQQELEDSGFSIVEILAITRAIIAANGLDDEKIKVATESFLAARAAEEV